MFGRYRNRYPELDRTRDAQKNFGTIDGRTPLSDLAAASFGSARVSCWTTAKDRQWGRENDCHAGILRFRLQASGPEDCRINGFELDLRFSALETIVISQGDSGVGTMPGAFIETEDDICFLDLPAPTCVRGEVSNPPNSNWKFTSFPISKNSGRATDARWIWEADGDCRELEGRTLYGGIAVRHPGEPFTVACQVRGKVWKPGSPSLRLKFSVDHHSPRLWNLVPEIRIEDLGQHIDRLEAEMVKLNTTIPYESSMNPTTKTGIVQPEQRTYGSSSISGSSTVHMGDSIHNYWLSPTPVMQR